MVSCVILPGGIRNEFFRRENYKRRHRKNGNIPKAGSFLNLQIELETGQEFKRRSGHKAISKGTGGEGKPVYVINTQHIYLH